MPKFYGVIIAIISVVTTAIVIGRVNNLDYWRRIHTINCEITRPASQEGATNHDSPEHTTSGSPPLEVNADKPTDKESVDGWLAWAKAARGRDPNWTPQTYTRLGDIKGVQSCDVEFTVLQIDDNNTRIVAHHGERLWLTGYIPGLVVNKAYTCKALFSPAGSYQYKTATEGVRTLPSYRFLGEFPEYLAARK